MGIEIDYSLPARRVSRLLDQLVERSANLNGYGVIMGGPPPRPEFISQVLQDWCKDEAIELCRIEPGKPTQNAYIERFNGAFRRELLDAHIFTSIRQVRQTVDAWLAEYNSERPH